MCRFASLMLAVWLLLVAACGDDSNTTSAAAGSGGGVGGSAGAASGGAGGDGGLNGSGGGGAGGAGGSGACVARIDLGGRHSCAVRGDGSLWCWGDNTFGQLGVGMADSETSPAQVTALTDDVMAFESGFNHTCATTADGGSWCWGRNESGQLGDGSTLHQNSPVPIAALGDDAVAFALGVHHSCARKSNGTMWCWGSNEVGQLGNGSMNDSMTPLEVAGLTAVVAESSGHNHTCALRDDGSVWCWGYNFYGQLGNDSAIDSSTPVQVATLTSNVVELGVGAHHGCARKGDGTIWCWGRNQYSQLGDGTTDDKPMPVEVTALSNDNIQLAVGANHGCVAKSDGSSWCWGHNATGQLGIDSMVNFAPPQVVSGLADGVRLAAGDIHTCAWSEGATFWCWGYNQEGALGTGTTDNSAAPVAVPFCR